MKEYKQSKYYYGWWVVGGLFFATFFGTWGRYILAAMIGFINKDLGWSVSEINLSVSIALWVYAGVIIFIGRLIDLWGGRKIILTGSVLLVVGFILLSTVTTLWGLYLIHGILLALACAMTHAVPVQAVARKWFIKRAGLVAGILATAFAISQTLIAPLLTQGASMFNWRVVCLAASLFGVIVFILNYWLVRDTPESIGLQPYGFGESGEKVLVPSAPGALDISFAQALKTLPFWAVLVAYGLLAVPVQGFLVNVINWANAIGVSPGSAGLAATAMNICAIPGKIIWGLLGDKIGKRQVLILGSLICFLVLLGGFVCVHNSTGLFVLCVFFGFGYGAGISLIAPYLGDLFGRQNVASLFGVVTAAHGFVGGFGPLLWGITFDRTGSYNLAALISGIIYFLVAVCFILARPPKFGAQKDVKNIPC